MTSFTEKEMIQGALDAGARGYLLKNVKGRDLVDAIAEVYQGGQNIALEARQSLHLSEQLSLLDQELNKQQISTALLAELFNKHLPKLFPNYQIQCICSQTKRSTPTRLNPIDQSRIWDGIGYAHLVK